MDVHLQDTEVFAFIPRLKVQGTFYKSLADFAAVIGMTRGQIDAYKSRHHYKNMIEALQAMQRDRIPAYKTEYGLLSYSEARKRRYTYAQIEKLDIFRKTDKFRHSPALENTRLWCLVGQTFLRSSIQGRFPVSTSPPAYGQRQRTHGE